MLAAGCTAEQIVAAVKADAAIEEQRLTEKRSRDAERQRKHRSKGKPSRNVTVTPRDSCDPPIDKYHTPSLPQSSNDDSPPFAEKFVSVWNDAAGRSGLPKARPLPAERVKKLRLRVKEYGEAEVLEAVERLHGSKFHCGENDRGWKANIGWLLKSAENVAKALELDKPNPAADRKLTPAELAAFYRRIGRPEEAEKYERKALGVPSG